MGRAVHRWETDDIAPTKRHQRELVTAIRAARIGAETALAAAFAAAQTNASAAPVAMPAASPTAPVLSSSEALEPAVLRMADDLDLPARRLRRPMARLFARLGDTDFTHESAQKQLDGWIAEQG